MQSEKRNQWLAQLQAICPGLPNAGFFCQVMASWLSQSGVLGENLGMPAVEFRQLTARYFPGLNFEETASSGKTTPRQRAEETADLVDLMLADRAGRDISETWVAQILAAACLGNDHLWQDTGLWSRKDLSAAIQENFPALFARNVKDMKWKKFFYKQLCNREGMNLCRAPSCEVCSDYAACFGPEQ